MIPDRKLSMLTGLSGLFEEEVENVNKTLLVDNNNGDDYEQSNAVWPSIEASSHARNTINPIRRIVDAMRVEPNPDKALLQLHIGDPTIAGVLPTNDKVKEAVADALMSGQYNGYGPAVGFVQVRQALAEFVNAAAGGGGRVQADDIILTSGCSHALQMAIESLADSGANILVPKPGK